MGDRRRGAGVDDRALMGHGQEAGAEVALLIIGKSPGVWQHHKGRQVVRFTAERVTDPGTETGKTGKEKAGIHQITARTMHVRLRYHRHQECHLVHAPGEARQQAADPTPALPMLLELEHRLEHRSRFARGRLDSLARAGVEFLTVPLHQIGLVIEQIALARTTVHEKLNDAPSPRRVMRSIAQRSSQRHGGCPELTIGQQSVLPEQMGHRDATQAAAKAPEELAPR